MNEWVNNDCEKHGLQEVNCLLVQKFADSRKCCTQCSPVKGNQQTATKLRLCDDLLTKVTDRCEASNNTMLIQQLCFPNIYNVACESANTLSKIMILDLAIVC